MADLFVGFAVGAFVFFFLGIWLEGHKWAASARHPYRVHRFGRLYQVTLDEETDHDSDTGTDPA